MGNGNIRAGSFMTVGIGANADANAAISNSRVTVHSNLNANTTTGGLLVTGNIANANLTTTVGNGNIWTGKTIYTTFGNTAIGSANANTGLYVGSNSATNVDIRIDSASSANGGLVFQKAGTDRWAIGTDDSAANGNIVIRNYGQSGNSSLLTFSERFANGANTIEGNIYIGSTAGTTALYAANTSNANIVTIAPTAGNYNQALRSRGSNRTPYWGPAGTPTTILYTANNQATLAVGAGQITNSANGNLTIDSSINQLNLTNSSGVVTLAAGIYKVTISGQIGPQNNFTPGQWYVSFSNRNDITTSVGYGAGVACGTYLSNIIPNGDAYTASMVGTINISSNTNFYTWYYTSVAAKIYLTTVTIEQIG
jgi:hypothetical protein